VNPKVQMKGPGICIKGANLLPASAFNFLEVMKVLLNGKTGRHGLKNLRGQWQKGWCT